MSLTQHGSGSTAGGNKTFSFGDPTKTNFVLEHSRNGSWSLKSNQEVAEKDIETIIADALDRVSSGDLSGNVVYQTTLKSRAFSISPESMLQFARLLGDQVTITGRRRLSDRVLLEFSPEPPKDPAALQLFALQTEIKVTIFVPGPIASDLTQKIAAGMAEITGAICALALGCVVEVPMSIFPTKPDDVDAAKALRYDISVLGLARDGVSLDVFGEFSVLGGADVIMRIRGALLSYHAAIQQAVPDVATILLVSSLEALITPRQAWRKDKATKRFIEAIEELCPDVVDELVNHANVQQAFDYRQKGGIRARRRQLLDQIYTLRSDPSHSGIGLSGAGMLSMFVESGSMRIALLSDLVRGALLRFLQAPRSSLIGHPLFNQQPTSEHTPLTN